MPVELTCQSCGGCFEVPPSRAESAKFCSSECYGESINRDDSKWGLDECEQCGQEFECLKSRDRKFCSKQCNIDSQRSRVLITCPVCDKEFETVESQKEYRRCCSRSCMGKWQSQQRVGKNHPNYVEPLVNECATCGDVILRKPARVKPYKNQFCDLSCYSTHVSKTMSGAKHPSYTGGYTGDYGEGWTEEKRERVRERDGRKCRSCGKTAKENGRKLDVHHIQKKDSFDDAKKRNSMSNLVTLCLSCHKRWESISPLFPQTT